MLHIFTLTWNGLDKMKRLHESLIPTLEGIDYIWHIKDNGSADGSKEFLDGIKSEKIIPYYTGHNKDSFAKGMNYLYAESKAKDSDLILLLNNDIVFGDKESIKEMMKLMTDDVGIVGARLLYTDSNLLQHAGVIFSRRYNYLPYHYKHKKESDEETEQNRDMQAVTAALALTRGKEFGNIWTNKDGSRGMDEGFFWCFDDVDACLSIKYKQNKRVVYCGKTKIYHEESASLKKNPVNKLMSPHNVGYFRKKWGGVYKKDD